MKFEATAPIYLQVGDAIKKDIVTGRVKPGEKLPSARELAIQYTINPNTAARVYQNLEQEGICATRRGMGTYVVEDSKLIGKVRMEMAQHLVLHFVSNMKELGFSGEEIRDLIKEEK